MAFKATLKATIAATALGIGVAVTASPAQTAEIRCDSRPGSSNYCRIDTSPGVELRHQHSRQPCYQNDTWGYDRRGIWVANGCSATFRVGREKDDDNAAAIGLGILALGIIGAIASQDDNNRDDGYQPPPSAPPPGYNDGGYYDDDEPYGGANIVSCDSKNYKIRYCPAPVRDYVELVHQRSKRACRYGKTWGYDRRGVWVNKGCRADFAIY